MSSLTRPVLFNRLTNLNVISSSIIHLYETVPNVPIHLTPQLVPSTYLSIQLREQDYLIVRCYTADSTSKRTAKFGFVYKHYTFSNFLLQIYVLLSIPPNIFHKIFPFPSSLFLLTPLRDRCQSFI